MPASSGRKLPPGLDVVCLLGGPLASWLEWTASVGLKEPEAEVMAPSVKSLPCKFEELILIPRARIFKKS